ncbi:MAG: alpha-hydroxy-acid oxidizing protein [Mycobacteriaceae bacterium]
MNTPSTSHNLGRTRQDRIYRDGISGINPIVPTDPHSLEETARRILGKKQFAYIAGGAGSELTMQANLKAFDDWAIVPRFLRDVSERDLSVSLFGVSHPTPLLLAPIGALELAHPDADKAVAQAAAENAVPYIFSNQACLPMETTAAAMNDSSRWFQLYWSTEEDLVDSFLERAEAINAEAIAVTLDTTMLGWRPQDLNLGSLPFSQGIGIAQYTSDPVFNRIMHERRKSAAAVNARPKLRLTAMRTLLSITKHHPGSFFGNLFSAEPRLAVETFLKIYSRPSLSWSDLASLRSRTKLPIVLKGILHPDDARKALDAGVDGIVVSNHGGRQVDGSIATLETLPEIVQAVGTQLTILLDSGIRTGADVFKALALGAHAVLLGRPYAYGLAIAGQAGASQVIANILAELDLTLGLSGYTSLSELSPEALRKR